MSHDDFHDEAVAMARLGKDEKVIWQGAPDRAVLARRVFKTRLVAFYFGLIALSAVAFGNMGGAMFAVLAGMATLGLLHSMAWLAAKSSRYVLTDRRLILRIGMAIEKTINLPLGKIGAGKLADLGNGHGDIALDIVGPHSLGYALLWPHARPWKLSAPEPMLRALPDAAKVANILANAVAAIEPVNRHAVTSEAPAPAPTGLKEKLA
ncbi:photosynthetic complex putative assembly protein PuhB [Sphingomicrobium sediminis]|uniref:Photosynthetic complex putative assembly protein PuhB n=1 Tax=Sphingomicrobium sediminis TaxID=2950949 RepID=A0A9X2EJ05_9SPHN|nr:photosynthetic complex putative assembly protein PuhB [Sphingomicrobium sediminis]MCM8556504.1 photosynthetic complex putative assembly protein PuhB [Sphingomicrobium sediminis]